MNRRTILASLSVLAIWPLQACAQNKDDETQLSARATRDIDIVKKYFIQTKTPDYADAVDTYLTDDVRYKGTGREANTGKAYVKERLGQFRQGFGYDDPEVTEALSNFAVDDKGNVLVSHKREQVTHGGEFRGIPASGQSFEGIDTHYIFRVNDAGLITGYTKTMDYPLMATKMGVTTEQIIGASV